MFHLIYVSHAIQPFSEEDLIELLKSAREKNKRLGITGMLLYLNEKFIQVLEGEKQKVNAVMDKIVADPRHHKISILMEGNTRERIFHNWSMGFKRLQHHDFKKLSGFADVEEFFHKTRVTNDSNPLLIFLKLFYTKNLVDHPEAA